MPIPKLTVINLQLLMNYQNPRNDWRLFSFYLLVYMLVGLFVRDLLTNRKTIQT